MGKRISFRGKHWHLMQSASQALLDAREKYERARSLEGDLTESELRSARKRYERARTSFLYEANRAEEEKRQIVSKFATLLILAAGVLILLALGAEQFTAAIPFEWAGPLRIALLILASLACAAAATILNTNRLWEMLEKPTGYVFIFALEFFCWLMDRWPLRSRDAGRQNPNKEDS